MSEDHTNYSIVEISQNTGKNPGDLRRPAVSQPSVKTLSANAGVKKNHKREKL